METSRNFPQLPRFTLFSLLFEKYVIVMVSRLDSGFVRCVFTSRFYAHCWFHLNGGKHFSATILYHVAGGRRLHSAFHQMFHTLPWLSCFWLCKLPSLWLCSICHSVYLIQCLQISFSLFYSLLYGFPQNYLIVSVFISFNNHCSLSNGHTTCLIYHLPSGNGTLVYTYAIGILKPFNFTVFLLQIFSVSQGFLVLPDTFYDPLQCFLVIDFIFYLISSGHKLFHQWYHPSFPNFIWKALTISNFDILITYFRNII